jgi:Ca2+-binding RTX toxin-like protein
LGNIELKEASVPTRKWGSEKAVNPISAEQLNSDVARLTNGNYAVVWQDNTSGAPSVYAQLYAAAGQALGGVIQIGGSTEINSEPSVTALADGGFYVTYTQDVGTANHIEGKVYNASGTFVRDQPVIITAGSPSSARPIDSDVASLGNGSVVVWTYGNDQILARTFPDGPDGAVTFSVSGFAVADKSEAVVAGRPDGTGFLVAWEQENRDFGDSDVSAALYSPAGVLQDELLVDTLGGDPAVAWLDNNRAVIAYTDTIQKADGTASTNSLIAVQIFDVSDSLGDFGRIVSLPTAAPRSHPMIAVGPDGSFVVAWQDDSGAGVDSDAAIYLQAFNASGGTIGSQIVVNTTTSGDQLDPSLTALADGRVVVSWTDESSGNADIRTQIVDPRDGIVTGTAAGDTLYGHDLVADEISAGAGNDFLIGLKQDDALYGGDGNDRLRGGRGGDDLDGGAGSDLADYLDSSARVVVNLTTGSAAEGFADGDAFVSIENVFGSAFNDLITGSATANILTGAGGADHLTGGLGPDRFDVNALAESTVALGGRDTIADFSRAAGDKIDLSTIDANATAAGNQAFTFIGTAAFTAAGQVRYVQSGGVTVVSANVDAALAADLAIAVTGTTAFIAGDFFL